MTYLVKGWSMVAAALVWLLVLPIRGYQLVISPMTPATCKFHPTCSAYAVRALRRHGPIKGPVLAAYRVGRCHPWQAGGLDPVPAKGKWRPDITPDGRTVIPLTDLRHRARATQAATGVADSDHLAA